MTVGDHLKHAGWQSHAIGAVHDGKGKKLYDALVWSKGLHHRLTTAQAYEIYLIERGYDPEVKSELGSYLDEVDEEAA
ncbi:MAG TPA: hypothetical protein VEF04_04825 [Blastocatellia bacterium]|nr:hypothetical protein [Blastocatellia bacterium]